MVVYDMTLLFVFLAGFLGGLIRGLMGVSKYITSNPSKPKKVRKDWLVVTLLSSGGLGLIVGVFITDDVKFALLAGYAGTDFLENIFKIKMNQKKWE